MFKLILTGFYLQVKIWFQNRRMKWKKDHKLPNTKIRSNSSSSVTNVPRLMANLSPSSDPSQQSSPQGYEVASPVTPTRTPLTREHSISTPPQASVLTSTSGIFHPLMSAKEHSTSRADHAIFRTAVPNFK